MSTPKNARTEGGNAPDSNRIPTPSFFRRIVVPVVSWMAVAVAVLACAGLFVSDGRGHGKANRRSQCKNNLKQIGLALQNYFDVYRSFPPAYIADDDGRPMHNWRVLLLPFLEQKSLYEKYRFDEPWDGPHNRLLADRVVPVFNCPDDDHADWKLGSTITSYVTVVGPETAWRGTRPTTIADVSDGMSNTLAVVEIANSGIHWMEPRDLHVLQMAPTINPKAGHGISSPHTGGAHVLTYDGAVRYFNEKISADSLRAWLTAHAGDHSDDF